MRLNAATNLNVRAFKGFWGEGISFIQDSKAEVSRNNCSSAEIMSSREQRQKIHVLIQVSL
jgi:hypothetical protein